jgi:hypothetical protein
MVFTCENEWVQHTHIKSRKITFLLFYYLLQIGYYKSYPLKNNLVLEI